MLAHFSLLSGSWVHFSRLAAFVAPFGRFFRDLGRSSLDFGAPSWPYVGTHFALDGIFRHAAGIAAKKPCWHSLSAFRFHYAARRYVRSTWNWNQVGSSCSQNCDLGVFWLLLGASWSLPWNPPLLALEMLIFINAWLEKVVSEHLEGLVSVSGHFGGHFGYLGEPVWLTLAFLGRFWASFWFSWAVLGC